MKPRHAAALVLVGWYLMLPPIGANDSPDPSLPLPQGWSIYRSFDTASECENAKSEYGDKASKKLGKIKKGTDEYTYWHIYGPGLIFSQCIATDDPRLKGN